MTVDIIGWSALAVFMVTTWLLYCVYLRELRKPQKGLDSTTTTHHISKEGPSRQTVYMFVAYMGPTSLDAGYIGVSLDKYEPATLIENIVQFMEKHLKLDRKQFSITNITILPPK